MNDAEMKNLKIYQWIYWYDESVNRIKSEQFKCLDTYGYQARVFRSRRLLYSFQIKTTKKN